MQLSASTTSPSDPSFASLLAGGDIAAAPAQLGAPVGEFAQLYPGLAPARAGLVAPIAGPAAPASVALGPLAAALRTFTPPTAATVAPAVNAPAAEAPAPFVSAEETPPAFSPPSHTPTATVAKPSRPSSRPVVITPKAAAETSAAPLSAAVVPSPENLFVPPAPSAAPLPLDATTEAGIVAAPQSFARAELASRQFSPRPSSPALPSRPVAPAAPSIPGATVASLVAATPATLGSAVAAESSAVAAMEPAVFRSFLPDYQPPAPTDSLPASASDRTSLAPTPASEGITTSSPRDLVSTAAPAGQLESSLTARSASATPLQFHASLASAPVATAELAPRPLAASPLPLTSSEQFTANGATVTTAASASNSPASVPASVPASAALAPAQFVATDSAPAPLSLSKAKFAVRAEKFSGGKNLAFSGEDKKILSTESEEFKVDVTHVGTDVAKSSSVMFSATFTDRPTPAAVLPHVSFAPVERASEIEFTPGLAAAAIETPAAPIPVASAHRAVEAVLVAADRFSSGDQHSVTLQFSVGDTELNVRVELRADEVRATFHTDSPELRDALSHEWQAAQASSPSERSFRLAPPVITSAQGYTSSSAFAGGDTSSRQRHTTAQHAEQNALASLATAARASLGASSAFGDSTSPVTAPRRGAQRLFAHA